MAWYNRQPLPLKILVVVSPLVIGKLVDEALKRLGSLTGFADWQVAGVLIGALILFAVVSFPFDNAKPQDPLPPIDFDDLEIRRVFPIVELEKLRFGLHQDIYGGSAPIGDEITRMYARNPGMGVGIYDPARDDYVAFATAWPVSEKAGKQLMSGAITENDLKADDVLPAAENPTARYVLVPAFGAAGEEGSAERTLLGFKLSNELRRTLRQNFFRQRNRKITLIATGFSPDGEKWCRRNGMKECCVVRLPGNEKEFPVFAKQIGWDDID